MSVPNCVFMLRVHVSLRMSLELQLACLVLFFFFLGLEGDGGGEAFFGLGFDCFLSSFCLFFLETEGLAFG